MVESADDKDDININKDNNRRSRKKDERKPYVAKPRQGPNVDGPIPVLVIHGVKQVCDEYIWTNLVEKLQKGTKGVVECIEIGNGALTSIFSTVRH